MGKSQHKREEIEEKYTWDLSYIYKKDSDWQNDFNKVSKEIKQISNFKGILVSNAKNLLNYLNLSCLLERKLYKLYYYANLKHDQDTTNSKYQEMLGKIKNLINKYEELDAYSNPELMRVDYSLIKDFYKQEPKLKEYEFILENIYRFKKHILDDDTEKLLSSLSKVFDKSAETFEMLTDADMKFGMITDEKGHEVELTESNYRVFLQSKDRNIRKKAFEQLLGKYSEFKNTISSTFAGNVDMLTTLAKLKHYRSSLEASLFSDNVSPKVYNNLIDTINDNLNVIYKYFDLKKKFLKLDEFHLYDQYVDLVDVYNNVGKRSGAYSSGFYDTKPYVLLNYENTLNDVSTLAHELGHSMHTYYSCLNNPYQYSKYTIFVAEVASTVNELLLNLYLLNNTSDKEEKKYILSNLMDLFKATLYRQTMFAEYERDMHLKNEKGEVLTNELLCNEYYKLNLKYFGPDVVVDDLIKYEWERIPHFYYDFYVYKYVIGLSCACFIVDGILNKKDKALENYLKFLSSGGSDYPINELKIAGIDVTKKEVIESAIKMFDGFIDQFIELM